MDDERWRIGFALLGRHEFSFDLQAPWWNLDQAAELARDFPATQIIVNHTGLPAERSSEGLAAWRHALEAVVLRPNVTIIRDTIATFGADRCMFASNFPVDSLVASYKTILEGFLAAIADRTPAERKMLLHDNARRIYRL